MKVLIVEDNALIATNLEMLMEDLGHACPPPAASAHAALETARDETPDLALVDLALADGWTGPGLIDALAEIGVPSVVVSGQVEEFSPPSHVVGTFTKPVDEAALAVLLRGFAANREPEIPGDE